MSDKKITLQDFSRIYTTGHMLGRGGNGTVHAGYRNTDQIPVAIKMVEKTRTPMVKIHHLNNNNSNINSNFNSFIKVITLLPNQI